MLLAGSVAYFVATSWWRVVDAFVQGLPAEGRVEAGVLEWPNKPGVATSNRHLEIRVSAGKPTSSASTSDFTLGFFRDRIRIAGVLGYVDLAYRDFQLDFPLNSIDIAPYWEAWKNPMIVFSGFLSAVVILATWWMLSVIYSPMTRVMASLFAGQLSWPQAVQVSAAGLLPAALIIVVAIVLYAEKQLNLFALGGVWIAHVVIGWVFVCGGAIMGGRQVRRSQVIADNPFGGASKRKKEGTVKRRNPFQ